MQKKEKRKAAPVASPVADLMKTLTAFLRGLKNKGTNELRQLLEQAIEQYRLALPVLVGCLQDNAHRSLRGSFKKDKKKRWFRLREIALLTAARQLIQVIFSPERLKIESGLTLANQLEQWQEASDCSLHFIFWQQPGKDTPEPTRGLRVKVRHHNYHPELHGGVPVPLAQLPLRHATSVSAFIDMLAAATEKQPPELHFKGHFARAQYRGAPLAWFGLVLPDEYENRREAVQERYGTVLFTFPCQVLLGERKRHLYLGWREYKEELSQTVLVVDHSEDKWVFTSGFSPGSGCYLEEIEQRNHWPAAYRPAGQKWCHPEFAVHNGLVLTPTDGVGVKFQNHGFCVKGATGHKCHDCSQLKEGRAIINADQARAYLVSRVRKDNQLRRALYQFQTAFNAFSVEDWTALVHKIDEDEDEHEQWEEEEEEEEEDEPEEHHSLVYANDTENPMVPIFPPPASSTARKRGQQLARLTEKGADRSSTVDKSPAKKPRQDCA